MNPRLGRFPRVTAARLAVSSTGAKRPTAAANESQYDSGPLISRSSASRAVSSVSTKKPPPLGNGSPARKRCPVCGEISYSQAGIHPQCNQVRSESERLKRVEKSAVAAQLIEELTQRPVMGRWDKTCPRCGTRLHSRKKTCECGHVFHRPAPEHA